MGKKVLRIMALLGNAANLHLLRGTRWYWPGGTHPPQALGEPITVCSAVLSSVIKIIFASECYSCFRSVGFDVSGSATHGRH